MDVNGVRFHLIQGERNWRDALDDCQNVGLEWDRVSQSVGLQQLTIQFGSHGQGRHEILTPDNRRGADCDRFGNWYWIDQERTGILILPCPERNAVQFWTLADMARPCAPESRGFFRSCPEEPAWSSALRLSALAITRRHYLVAGTTAPGGILIFDLHAGGQPLRQIWPESMQFEPIDMAATPDGGVRILGRDASGFRVWRLDAHLRSVDGPEAEIQPAVTDHFQPEDRPNAGRGTDACLFASGLQLPGLAAGSSVPRAIECISDSEFLILETPDGAPHSKVLLYQGERLAGSVELDQALLGAFLEPPSLVRGHDFAFVAGKAPEPGITAGQLYVAAENGDQAFAFELRATENGLTLEFIREYYPMRRCSGLALVCCGGWPHYDLAGQLWMPLAAHLRRQYAAIGEIEGIVLDGKIPNATWHRIVFDGTLPDGTRVEFFTRAGDQRETLQQAAWRQEPSPYLRAEGTEVAYHDPFTGDEQKQAGTGSWELLFQGARGRFIELRLRFRGDGRHTPRIRSLRIYYQRFSYLERYIPAVYREDSLSASFLERYLANAEGIFTSLEDRIAKAEGLFDARIAPAEYLEWLSGWFDYVFDADWEDSRRRLFLRYATLLFEWRGTVIGMLAMIRLAINPCPDESIFQELRAGREISGGRYGNSVRIVERFLSRRFGGVAIGDPSAPQQPGLALAEADWTPSQGADPLHESFRKFLIDSYSLTGSPSPDPEPINLAWGESLTSVHEIRLSPVVPANSNKADDWRAFLDGKLNFTYADVTPADAADYRKHLERRYARIDALNSAYGLFGANAHNSFADIPLPAENDFPQSGARLVDWIAFVSLALPIRDAAYRFSVLIPTTPSETAEDRQRRMSRVEAVVRREKPSHTDFEIRPYWALFQVGTARLGLDTTLGEGSRFTAIEMGRTATGEGFLAHGHPWNIRRRAVIGRDSAGEITL